MCENCHKRPAAVHLTQVINNKRHEMYLCEQCAKEKNNQLKINSPINFGDFFSGLMGFPGASQYVSEDSQGAVCDKCGMSYEDFQRIGKMGCSNCYEIFGEQLKPLIKRIHGSMQHNGKTPQKFTRKLKVSNEIEKLRQMLNEAILHEEYEKAAELRDKIKSMEIGKE